MLSKNILVTGGAGFIGSNLIIYLLKRYPTYKIINLDKLSYAANLNNLSEISTDSKLASNYHFIHGDITNTELVHSIFTMYQITDVFHLAAESHVDNSINNPEIFLTTNIIGTYTLINIARQHWKDNIQNRFLHVSTDEVFGSLGDTGLFSESTPYAPNSPYSASKASSDFIVRSYHHTYGVNTVTTNCSNNYGPKQHAEKLIPVIINKALNLQPIPIYGNGLNIRDWLFVEDHCSALDKVFHHGQAGQSYNIGGNCELSNLQVANTICGILDEIKPLYEESISSYKELITFVKDRPGHDYRYAIDSTKLQKELDWCAKTKFINGIKHTIQWYLVNKVNLAHA